jgi:DNA-binding transcriptional ArsR family regulator
MAELEDVIDREQLYQLSAGLKRLADAMAPSPHKPGPTPPSANLVRAMIRARRLREKFLGSGLFADPAWDMLLDLFAARLERRRVSVSSLCVAAAVPPTTALRWIAVLEEKGLAVKRADPRDRRRVFVEISDESAVRVQSLLVAAGSVSPLLM